MSPVGRKSKVAVPAGIELDWDNENHRRHIEEEAYAFPPHPRPTMKPPPRSPFWWFWRMFGYIVFRPARRAWSYYTFAYYPHLHDRDHGPWTRRYPSSEKVYDWLRRSRRGTFANFLYWLFAKNYSLCPHCGFDCYEDSYYLDDKSYDMFELVEGGGIDYWGEANDCHGWMWCYRCGDVNWETV